MRSFPELLRKSRGAPADTAVEVVGALQAVPYVSSSAKDTDFVAKLMDVYPDGTVCIVQQGIARARAGTHISAMGADNVGKQELEAELLSRGRRWGRSSCKLPRRYPRAGARQVPVAGL